MEEKSERKANAKVKRHEWNNCWAPGDKVSVHDTVIDGPLEWTLQSF